MQHALAFLRRTLAGALLNSPVPLFLPVPLCSDSFLPTDYHRKHSTFKMVAVAA